MKYKLDTKSKSKVQKPFITLLDHCTVVFFDPTLSLVVKLKSDDVC